MTMHDRLLPAQAAPRSASAFPLGVSISSVGRRIADWLATAADYYAAAAVYEQLSGLSDAELQRRGLSRATLAWDVSQACDRAALAKERWRTP
jgi:hypothetical protein